MNISNIFQLFKEDNGNYSSMRFISIFWLMALLAGWIKTGCDPSFFSQNNVFETFSILIGGKTIQKFAENKGTNNNKN